MEKNQINNQFILLVCRHCNKIIETLPSSTDPIGTAKVISCCPSCYDGQYVFLEYFDINGNVLLKS